MQAYHKIWFHSVTYLPKKDDKFAVIDYHRKERSLPMPAHHEYELVPHRDIGGFRLFLVNMLYRTPHLHKDIELCLMLNGEVSVYSQGKKYACPEGSFLLLNSYQVHELHAKEPVTILSLQVSPDFFALHFPQMP